MYCKNCGLKSPKNSKYCIKCGAEIEKNSIDSDLQKHKIFKSKYILIIISQLTIVMLFSIAIYFMFKIETIFFNPIPYTIGLSTILLLLDLLILIYLFKTYTDEDVQTDKG